jgi:hypothetical protein
LSASRQTFSLLPFGGHIFQLEQGGTTFWEGGFRIKVHLSQLDFSLTRSKGSANVWGADLYDVVATTQMSSRFSKLYQRDRCTTYPCRISRSPKHCPTTGNPSLKYIFWHFAKQNRGSGHIFGAASPQKVVPRQTGIN